MIRKYYFVILCIPFFLAGCIVAEKENNQSFQVLAVESFLADIAQNVAGSVFIVDSLIPSGVDPHSFELTPGDLARMETSQLLLINGGGLEVWLDPILADQDLDLKIISCSAGLENRVTQSEGNSLDHAHEQDPHFWMDPIMVLQYVRNIKAAFSVMDPPNADEYANNAAAYIEKIIELDDWIKNEVSRIPPEKRLLITNHENLGYFADRYGFNVIGTILMSTTSSSMPSASSLADLENTINATSAPAIFLHTGENAQLADQIASDLGILVVTGLYTHSLSDLDGPAPDYILMMKYDVSLISNALR